MLSLPRRLQEAPGLGSSPWSVTRPEALILPDLVGQTTPSFGKMWPSALSEASFSSVPLTLGGGVPSAPISPHPRGPTPWGRPPHTPLQPPGALPQSPASVTQQVCTCRRPLPPRGRQGCPSLNCGRSQHLPPSPTSATNLNSCVSSLDPGPAPRQREGIFPIRARGKGTHLAPDPRSSG